MTTSGSFNNKFMSIKGHEFQTARKDVEEESPMIPNARDLDIFNPGDKSEFAPAKAVKFSAKTALDNLLFGSPEVSKGQINRGYLEPYMKPGEHASKDRAIAVRLKREIFIPIMEEAFNRYKGLDDVNEIMDTVKQKLKAAIGMHIDLSKHRVQRKAPQQRIAQQRRAAVQEKASFALSA